MTDGEAQRDRQLIAKLEAETSEQADEIERLKRELQATLGLLYEESDRRAKAEHELTLWKDQWSIK